MIENSKLLKNEKEDILKQLSEKEEVSETQKQVMKLNKRLFAERMSRKEIAIKNSELLDRVESFTRDVLINNIASDELHNLPFVKLRRAFLEFSREFPMEYFEDMRELGYLTTDRELTKKGALFLRSLITENL